MDPWLLSSSNSGAAHPGQPGGEGAGHLQQQAQEQQRVGDAGGAGEHQANFRQLPQALAGSVNSGHCFAFTDSFVVSFLPFEIGTYLQKYTVKVGT